MFVVFTTIQHRGYLKIMTQGRASKSDWHILIGIDQVLLDWVDGQLHKCTIDWVDVK